MELMSPPFVLELKFVFEGKVIVENNEDTDISNVTLEHIKVDIFQIDGQFVNTVYCCLQDFKTHKQYSEILAAHNEAKIKYEEDDSNFISWEEQNADAYEYSIGDR